LGINRYKLAHKRGQHEDVSPPWIERRSRILSPAEALREVQLRTLVEKERSQSYDYLLLRSSLTTDLVEKKAWWILAALFVFVEHLHRFPHMKELSNLLENLFSGKLKTGELPSLSLQNLQDSAEIEKQIGATKLRVKDKTQTLKPELLIPRNKDQIKKPELLISKNSILRKGDIDA
jgi:hypothetical protein